jgi:hypothetical protein
LNPPTIGTGWQTVFMDAGYSSAHLANLYRIEWGSPIKGRVNYLIIRQKSSRNGHFLVVNSRALNILLKEPKKSIWTAAFLGMLKSTGRCILGLKKKKIFYSNP